MPTDVVRPTLTAKWREFVRTVGTNRVAPYINRNVEITGSSVAAAALLLLLLRKTAEAPPGSAVHRAGAGC